MSNLFVQHVPNMLIMASIYLVSFPTEEAKHFEAFHFGVEFNYQLFEIAAIGLVDLDLDFFFEHLQTHFDCFTDHMLGNCPDFLHVISHF